MLQVPVQSEMFTSQQAPPSKLLYSHKNTTHHRNFFGGKITPRDHHHLDPDPCGGKTSASSEGSQSLGKVPAVETWLVCLCVCVYSPP